MKRLIWCVNMAVGSIVSVPRLVVHTLLYPILNKDTDDNRMKDGRECIQLSIKQLIECYEDCRYVKVCDVTNGPKHHRYVYEVQSPNYVGWIEFKGRQTHVNPDGEVTTTE